MTLIQPKTENSLPLFNKFLAVFFTLLVVGVVWLLIVYMKTVSLHHEVSQMQNQLETVEGTNATMNDQLFTMLDTDNLQQFAASRNLVLDTNPRYLQIQQTWQVASLY